MLFLDTLGNYDVVALELYQDNLNGQVKHFLILVDMKHVY